MTSSRHLAKLIGPAITALAVTEAMNFSIWSVNVPQVTYLNGTLLLVAGLAIIRAHNRWEANWAALITISGWGGAALGLYRMIAPRASQAPEGPATYAGLAVLAVVGLLLTIQAYRK